MRNQLKWTLAALALGILAMVGFAVAAAARGDGGEAEEVGLFTGRAPGRDLQFFLNPNPPEVRLAPERARLELPPGHGGIPPGRLRERLPEFDLEDLLPEDFPQRVWRFVERRDLLDEALGRFISAQVRYLDEDGKPASVQALGGTVSGVDVSEGTLTVTGNEPRATPQPFTITEDTRIRRDFRRADLADLEVNDRVVVIAVGEGDEAAVVLAFSPPEES